MNPPTSKIKILEKKEKLEITNQLKKQFGITEIPGEILKRGNERFFIFQGDLSHDVFHKVENAAFIERAGIYFAKKLNEEYRLSIEGVHLLKDQITKNIFEVNEEQMEQWMMGRELENIDIEKGIYIIKYKNDFLGCGKASNTRITNFIPKARRLKSKD